MAKPSPRALARPFDVNQAFGEAHVLPFAPPAPAAATAPAASARATANPKLTHVLGKLHVLGAPPPPATAVVTAACHAAAGVVMAVLLAAWWARRRTGSALLGTTGHAAVLGKGRPVSCYHRGTVLGLCVVLQSGCFHLKGREMKQGKIERESDVRSEACRSRDT